MTSSTKLFGRLAPRLPCPMRPGRIRSASSRVLIAIRSQWKESDGARCVEIVDVSAPSAGRPGLAGVQKPQANQPLGTDGRRSFSLAVPWLVPAVPWLVPGARAASPPNLRQAPPAREQPRARSWGAVLLRDGRKQAARLRRETGQIGQSNDDRRLRAVPIGRRSRRPSTRCRHAARERGAAAQDWPDCHNDNIAVGCFIGRQRSKPVDIGKRLVRQRATGAR